MLAIAIRYLKCLMPSGFYERNTDKDYKSFVLDA